MGKDAMADKAQTPYPAVGSPACAELDRFLRREEVSRLTGKSCSAIYRDMAEGRFPKAVKIGHGPTAAVAWLASEIAAWQRARIAESRAA